VATSTERSRRRRARLREALQPAGDAPPREPVMQAALRETLAALELGEADAGVARLALAHARVLDTARDPLWAARWHGPLLLDCLTSLGATPAARARMGGTPRQPQPAGPSPLDRLRESRASRRPSGA
jgi:hypothetical protein